MVSMTIKFNLKDNNILIWEIIDFCIQILLIIKTWRSTKFQSIETIPLSLKADCHLKEKTPIIKWPTNTL